MDSHHIAKLQRVVFERLTIGESRKTLFAELSRRLDETAANGVIRDAIREIAEQTAQGTYAAEAKRIRERKLVSTEITWRNIGFVLMGGGIVFTAISMLAGQPALALVPVVGGFLIVVVNEPKIKTRIAQAGAAVDRLLEENEA
ncbi:hypothetical protein [Brevundimonas sp. M20]|uniref:hypothetical protein n=1 Tax=Brevundimonas sp. M20 TaxID=2591463 RepID=UPI001146E527|nr:hypothetical protein [Brevundimonas sp. M20]QDH73210.1 hypothetical protein FKQ52_07065 [Brevundimonas sp. M20]